MAELCENDKINIVDQVEEDFGVLIGTLELMSGAATGDLGTIEECLIPVFDNLQHRVQRVKDQYEKLYYAVHPLPTRMETKLADLEKEEASKTPASEPPEASEQSP